MVVFQEGYLLKKGHLFPSWKSRWHVLLEQSLEYYESSSKFVKKGEVVLTPNSIVRVVSDCTFVVQTDDKSLEMSASTISERDMWMMALRRVICRNQLRILYRDCLTVNLYINLSKTLEDLLSDAYISYGTEIFSGKGFFDQIQQFWKVIPDLKWEVQEMIVEGNKVVVRSLASGSPRGDFLGLTGLDGSKSFHITTIDIHTIIEGKVQSTHRLEDWTTAVRQLSTGSVEYHPESSRCVFDPFMEPEFRKLLLDNMSKLYQELMTNNFQLPLPIVDELFHDDYLSYGSPNLSKIALIRQIQQYRKVIPDLKWEVQEMIVEGNKVVVRSLASGSPRGDFLGLTGLDGSKSFHITTIDIHTIIEGKVQSTHRLEDWNLALSQLKAPLLFLPLRIQDPIIQFYQCLAAGETETARLTFVIDSLFHDDYLSYGSPNLSKITLIRQIQQYRKVIPDLQWEVQEMIVEGNKVVVRSLASGSPRGDFLGLTGLDGSKSFHITTIDIHTIIEGKVQSTHRLEDWTFAIDQLCSRNLIEARDLSQILYRPIFSRDPDRLKVVDMFTAFYSHVLTYNIFTNIQGVMDEIFYDNYLSFGSQIRSKIALIRQIQQFWKVIPDLKWEVQEMIVEGNKVVVRSLASGSPRGDFLGLTGLDGSKSFHITTIDIHILQHDKVKYSFSLTDWATALNQLN